jgi:DNA-binding MarR family transcriptional regulator
MVPAEASQGVPAHSPRAPARSVRRATALRASRRRATARSRMSDSDASIIAFLTDHPGSTNGDIARGLNLDPDHIATCLTQLAGAGEISKVSHGYETSPDSP